MPYYKWQGISLYGLMQRGKLFAQSPEELDVLLFKRDIALLKSREIGYGLFQSSIKKSYGIQFLRTVSTLIRAGLLLPEVLLLASEQVEHPRFQGIIYTLAVDVHKGISLSNAMSTYPEVFDRLVVHMAHVGQETGALDAACASVADHMEMIENFRKQLRSAALMPCLTLGFFLTMAAIIFMVIIPHFAHIFSSVNQELPFITQLAVRVSDACNRWNLVYAGCLLGVLCVCLRKILSRDAMKYRKDALMLRIPYIGLLIKQSAMIYFLRALSMMVQGGVQLVPALNMAQALIKNRVIRNHCQQLAVDVESGSSLSQSLLHNQKQLFDSELIALVRVGEESGQLGSMLAKAACGYQAKVSQSLYIITTLFQPLFMIIMGLLVTGLIFSVYVPIFNLARVIG